MRAPGERGTQRHKKLGTFLSGRGTRGTGNCLPIITAGGRGLRGGCEKRRTGLLNDRLFLRRQCQRTTKYNIHPGPGIFGQHHIRQHRREAGENGDDGEI